MHVNYDERKLTELIVYVAARLQDDRSGGATKLDKVLFFADFAHVGRTGAPITGADYQKLEHGPAPRRMRPVRDALVAARHAELREEQFFGYRQLRLVPLREADLSVFTDGEIATVDKVLVDLDGLIARQLSDLCHEEAGWRLTEIGETIPYAAALVGSPQVSTPTSRRLEREAAERYGLFPS